MFKLDLLKCTVQRKESEIVSFVVALSTAQLMQIATVQYQIRLDVSPSVCPSARYTRVLCTI